MKKIAGISLIEIVISLVVIGIIGGSLIPAIYTAMEGQPDIEYTMQAVTLAKERMEIVLGQRQISGFSTFSDPCASASPPTICEDTGDYTVESTIASWNSNSNFKTITVEVTGPADVTIQALVSDF